jgi:hypothetical protein
MNKEQKTKEYLEKWQNVKLSDSARVRIQGELTEYARFHGVNESVRVGKGNRSIEQAPTKGASLIQGLLNLKPKSMTAFILTLALLVGGGTSYAAEGSVPGDALYPIKVEVNESIKSALAISSEAEARLQARLAEERLQEAEELAARGELSAEASANLATRLRTHYEQASKKSDEAETRGDYESAATVRASLEGSLRSHIDVLTDLNLRISGNQGETLITDIRTYADAAAEAQATATVDISAKVEIENTIKRAENVLSETKTKLERARGQISAEAYARAEARYDQGVQAVVNAKTHLRAELYNEAYSSAQSAIRIGNEVQTMIRSALQLKVDLRLDTNGLIDVQTNSDTDVKTGSESGSESDTNQTNPNQGNVQNDSDAEVEAETDINIDTGIIDTSVETDTSVRTDTGLRL